MTKTDLHKRILEDGFKCSEYANFERLDEERTEKLLQIIAGHLGEYNNDLIRDCLIVTADALFERGARKNPHKVYIYVRKFER